MDSKSDISDTVKKDQDRTVLMKARFLEALAMDRIAGNILVATNVVGISRDTVYDWKHKDTKFAEQFQVVLDKAIEKRVDFAEDKLDELVRKGNVTAIIFTLKKLRPKRWGDQIEQPVHQEYLHTISPEFSRFLEQSRTTNAIGS